MSGQSPFLEPDRERLIARLRRVAGGDLATPELERLADGDLAILDDVSLPARQGIVALLKPGAERPARSGALEKMVGEALNYVPVAYLDLARLAANAVARVVAADTRRPKGSGSMVSSRLFLTNNHVLATSDAARSHLLQFDYELDVAGSPKEWSEFRLDPDTFFWTCPATDLDVTLVAVGDRVTGGRPVTAFGYLPLSGAKDKHAEGDYVTIIQHPEGDYKQIALRENQLIGRGKAGNTLHYEADTLGGSSGSPVLNDQFELIALHHAGGTVLESTLENGEAVPDDSNEGIRVSVIVQRLRTELDTIPYGFRDLLAPALDPASTRPHLESAPPSPPAPTGPTNIDGSTVDALLPVRVHLAGAVRAEAIAPAGPLRTAITPAASAGLERPATAVPPAAPGVLERQSDPDPNYDRRRGYDLAFMRAHPVPLPRLSTAQLAHASLAVGAARDNDGVLLHFLHFSVVQHRERRLPWFTAVNIDGRRLRRINRQTGEVEATERWFLDPRIPDEEQLSQEVFDRQRPRIFDRGHMVRRLDPAWGSVDTATKAAADTFHFVNCCPQVSAFNQRAALWAGIEDYALENARTEKQRIAVFTGPVLGDDDPPYRDVLVPRAFWKVVVRCDGDRLRATAFLADQGDLLDAALALDDTQESFADLGRVETFQVRVADVASRTGLDFGDLPGADTRQLEAVEDQPLQSLDEAAW